MAKPKIGVQLIVFGGRQNEDLAGVLAEVKEAGYEGIEAGNLFQGCGEEAAKKALADTGLLVTGVHGGYGDLTQPDNVEQNMAYLKAVNSRYLICSGVSDRSSIKGYEDSAETFNELGRRCKDEGLVFCYHNHAWEFEDLGGVKGMHRLCELTDPELVKLCLDVYWVHIGGEDPAEFIARHADRAEYFHFKDGGPNKEDPSGRPYFIELGQGEVDLESARDAALKQNPEWIVCEQDRSEKDPKVSVTESMEYLRKIGL